MSSDTVVSKQSSQKTKLGLSLMKSSWSGLYLMMESLVSVFGLLVITSSLPYNYVLGVSFMSLLSLAILSWTMSCTPSWSMINRVHHISVLAMMFLFLFDLFVVSIRPITLALRVFINVSLGHFLISSVYLSLGLLSLIWMMELFVYTVQTYVFITLSLSYSNNL